LILISKVKHAHFAQLGNMPQLSHRKPTQRRYCTVCAKSTPGALIPKKTLFLMELWPRTPARSVKKKRGNSDFSICGAQRATMMALRSYIHIDFAFGMVFCVLGGLWCTSDDHRLELKH